MIKSFFDSLKRTRERFTGAIHTALPKGKKLTRHDIDTIEEILIGADVGVKAAEEIILELGEHIKTGEFTGKDAMKFLRTYLLQILGEKAPLTVSAKPHIIIVVGVNGTGKTTTIAKLASKYKRDGMSVLLAAADTFRAAAKEQLEIWAKQIGVDMVAAQSGADPAAVVFDAANKARAKEFNVMIADTAGRLHTKKNLMDELKKITRVSGKAITLSLIHI